MLTLKFIGYNDFPEYPIYKDDKGNKYVNAAYKLGDARNIYQSVSNGDYCEPYKRITEEIEFIDEPKIDPREKALEFEYQLLSRLQADCKYFLGYGYRNEKNLWALSVDEQIKKMKELWNTFPDDLKPEWCTMEQIEAYEREMKEEQ